MSRSRIGITMGDPAGIGPELCARVLSDASVSQSIVPVVFGSHSILQRAAEAIGVQLPELEVLPTDANANPDSAAVVDHGECDLEIGTVKASSGLASFNYVETSIRWALQKQIDAVVTNPINKEAWNKAGIDFPGHTELFANRCDVERFCMMMYSPNFSVVMATTHIGLASVATSIPTQRVLEVIELASETMSRVLDRKPKLAVLGLNPHAGENGLIGNGEEESFILPAIEAARAKGIDATDPLPPDTAFLPSWREEIDCYVCMYHDQALIPFKAFNFDSGVNVTLGLPMIRSSVDHGTAFDIAWQGRASVSSLLSAIEFAS